MEIKRVVLNEMCGVCSSLGYLTYINPQNIKIEKTCPFCEGSGKENIIEPIAKL